MNALTGIDPALDDLFHAEAAKQRALTAKEKRDRDVLLLAAQDVLGTEAGKRLLCWLIDQTGVFAPCFTGNSTTFFLEGKRAIGLDLYRLLMAANPNALQDIVNFKRNEDTHGRQ